MTGLVTQLAVSNSHLCRLQLSMDGTRLGCLGFSRTGPLGFTEVWEDGPVLRDLSVRLAALARSREEVEAARKVGGRGVVEQDGCLHCCKGRLLCMLQGKTMIVCVRGSCCFSRKVR